MTFREKQSRLVQLVGRLIEHVYSKPGWALTFSDARPTKPFGHMPGSLHYIGLAIDLNLFVNGDWKDADCPEWRELGAYWQSLDPMCAWGGNWGDFNHFSLRHDGKQ